MLGSAILDSAIGVIFGFLAVSLFTSAIVEAIQSALKTRAVNLRSAIKQLVNDPGFGGYAKALYEHALISPFGPGAGAPPAPQGLNAFTAKAYAFGKAAIGRGPNKQAPPAPASIYRDSKFMPSYIDKAQFARAFLDVANLSPSLSDVSQAVAEADRAAKAVNAAPPAADPVAPAIESLKAEIGKIPSAQIKDFLNGVVDRCGGDAQQIETEIANWFDAGMDRLSGKFKRRSQAWTFGIALVLAALVNVDTIRVANQVWAHPQILQGVDLKGLTAVDLQHADEAIGQIAALSKEGFPIGWVDGHFFSAFDPGDDRRPGKWRVLTPAVTAFWSALAGWLITAFATLFGAPFWFDTLQSLVRLKGSGPSPEEKAKGKAAAA